ncbi:hypothetical protein FY137_18380 [Agrobacterium tumefaciens]|nr:hypothetical protein FY137_18380 [Agrobacterium tumefaciens]
MNSGFTNASAAARSLGVSPSTYIHHENGTRDFGEEAAALYARRYHVSLPWLLLGDGEMATPELIEEQKKEAEEAARDAQEEKEQAAAVPPEFRDKMREGQQRLEEKSALETLRQMAVLPQVSPTFRRDDAILSIGWRRFTNLQERVSHPVVAKWGFPKKQLEFEFGCDPRSTIIFLIEGQANSPTLAHGDFVIVDTSIDDVVHDGLYLIADRLSYPQVRRLQANLFSDPRTVTISADSTPDQRTTAEISAISIIGHVRGKISRI